MFICVCNIGRPEIIVWETGPLSSSVQSRSIISAKSLFIEDSYQLPKSMTYLQNCSSWGFDELKYIEYTSKVYWVYHVYPIYTHGIFKCAGNLRSNRNTLFSYFQFWAKEFLFVLHCWRQLSHGLPAWSTLEQMVSLIWWFSAAERRVGGRHVLEIRFLNCISKYIHHDPKRRGQYFHSNTSTCLSAVLCVGERVGVRGENVPKIFSSAFQLRARLRPPLIHNAAT